MYTKLSKVLAAACCNQARGSKGGRANVTILGAAYCVFFDRRSNQGGYCDKDMSNLTKFIRSSFKMLDSETRCKCFAFDTCACMGR